MVLGASNQMFFFTSQISPKSETENSNKKIKKSDCEGF
jgi:hypothetical protein